MAAPFLLALHGELTVVGSSPDGDSMRFIADSPDAFDELARADRQNVAEADGSVQLRLEGIDTPETNLGPFAQPLGDRAISYLLIDEDNLPPDHAWTEVDADLLRRTVNAASLEEAPTSSSRTATRSARPTGT